jgi:hypothetical protein
MAIASLLPVDICREEKQQCDLDWEKEKEKHSPALAFGLFITFRVCLRLQLRSSVSVFNQVTRAIWHF